MVKKTISPIEQLKIDRQALDLKAKSLEKQLGESWEYAEENSASLLLHLVEHIMFRKKKQHNESFINRLTDNLTYYMGLAGKIWTIVQPLYSWWQQIKQEKLTRQQQQDIQELKERQSQCEQE
jgi:uncharacterized membrane protein